MKAVWKGYIVIGEFGVPIRLYSATKSAGATFVQLHEQDGSPVERPLFCQKEQREIPFNEVVKGIDVGGGKYVMLTSEELEHSTETPDKTLLVKQFCSSSDVEPMYYEKPYFLTAAQGGETGYSIIRQALAQTKTSAIATFLFYGTERIGAMQVHGDMIMLHQLRYSDELVPRSSIKTLAVPQPGPQEVSLMKQVIETYKSPLYMADYSDTYSDYISDLAERKGKGLPPKRQEQIPAFTTPEDEISNVLSSLTGEKNATLQ
jgi:DNA end-binding protein Ku